jgi:hypothetical protein
MAKPKSVKLEMTEMELGLQTYLLGGVQFDNYPMTVEVALSLRKKLQNAILVFKPKQIKDKYGKVITAEDLPRGRKLRKFPNRNRQIQKSKLFKGYIL